MKSVSLPLVANEESIEDALATLREAHRSGIVVQAGEELHLLFAGDLARARDEGRISVAEVTARELLPEPEVEIAGAAAGGAGESDLESFSFRGGFGYVQPAAYTAYRSTPGFAVVISAYESGADALEAPGAYKCTGPLTHYFPRPPVTYPGPCPECVTLPGQPEPYLVLI